MNFDMLKNAWSASVAAQPDANEVQRMTADARASAGRYERDARLRLIYGSTAFALTLAMLIALSMLPHVWPGMRFALLLWSASLIACAIGLWCIRVGVRADMHAPLADHLQAHLQRIRREIAYQRSLRWWFWVPFGIGFVAAMFWQPPSPPGDHPFLLLGTAVLWVWGLVNGPRHWPRKLQPQADHLQAMLEGRYPDQAMHLSNGESA